MVDIVEASRRGLDRDLQRRDLTINAIAFDLRSGAVLDPSRGRADLRAGRLRPPAEGAFRDDPVRALRLCRFMAQLPGFRSTAGARRGAAGVARALRRAAAERVCQELDKLLLARQPRVGLDSLETLGLRGAILPELDATVGCTAGAGRPDVWTHTIDAVELGAAATERRLPGARFVHEAEDRRVLRWTLLLHDVSKPETLATAPDGRPTFHGHEVVGERRADALLRRYRHPAARRRRVCRLIRLHLRPGHLADAGGPARGLRRLVRDAGEDLPLLTVHAAADARASGSLNGQARWRRLRAVLQRLLEMWEERADAPPPALVGGRDVMRILKLSPGPEIGRVLDQVREAQEDGTVRTRRQALAYLATVTIKNRIR
jgi:tRNA nucleotidyltransferase/poly(A) polymerase